MNISIQCDSILDNTKRALTNKLHEGNLGTLQNTLNNLVRQPNVSRTAVAIATVDHDGYKKDIGVCVIEISGFIGTYVKPDYRGNQIGEKLVTTVLNATQRNNNTCFAKPGIDEAASLRFYNKLGIFVDEFDTILEKMSIKQLDRQTIRLFRDGLRASLMSQNHGSKHYMWNYL